MIPLIIHDFRARENSEVVIILPRYMDFEWDFHDV